MATHRALKRTWNERIETSNAAGVTIRRYGCVTGFGRERSTAASPLAGCGLQNR